jgi:hypothetical protein
MGYYRLHWSCLRKRNMESACECGSKPSDFIKLQETVGSLGNLCPLE